MSLENIVIVLGVLLATSEGLALIPSVKANSIFQAIVGILKFLKEKIAPVQG